MKIKMYFFENIENQKSFAWKIIDGKHKYYSAMIIKANRTNHKYVEGYASDCIDISFIKEVD